MICCFDTRIQKRLFVEDNGYPWRICCEIDFYSLSIETSQQLTELLTIFWIVMGTKSITLIEKDTGTVFMDYRGKTPV